MYGEWQEAKTKCVVWGSIDQATLTRFCQFAYTGDYDTPVPQAQRYEDTSKEEPVPTARIGNEDHAGLPFGNGSAERDADLLSHEPADEPLPNIEVAPIIEDAPPIEGDPWSWTSSKTDRKKKKLKKRTKPEANVVYPSFSTLQYMDDRSLRERQKRREIIPNSEPAQNYTSVFLGHARLYVFAHEKGIESLKVLTLQKLQKTLAAFWISPIRVQDLVELAEYTYTNTQQYENRRDELRNLIVLYFVAEEDQLSQTEDFLSLMEHGGAFVRDFWVEFRKELIEWERL